MPLSIRGIKEIGVSKTTNVFQYGKICLRNESLSAMATDCKLIHSNELPAYSHRCLLVELLGLIFQLHSISIGISLIEKEKEK